MRLVVPFVILLLTLTSCFEPEPPLEGFVIVGASVIDGGRGVPRDVNVHVDGDVIANIFTEEPPVELTRVAAHGLTLAPGFIDTHSHGDSHLEELPDALAAVSQGITTIIVGQDGGGPFPLKDFFAHFEASPAAVNIASFAGHGNLRREILGDGYQRAATNDEVQAMRELLIGEMTAGALGLGTGLEYDPGIYASTEEVVTLAREARSWGGRYVSHLRSEDRDFWEAVGEIISIGREADIPVHISHIKLAMTSMWGRAEPLLARLEDARDSGLQVSADIYPYTYWQSTLTVMFPDRDYDNREAATFAVTEISTPGGMRIARYKPEPSYEGKTLAEISTIRRQSPEATLRALIKDAERMRAAGETDVESVIATSMDESDIAQLMAWRFTNIGSDGELDGAHPRGFGTFPRFFGRYVRERNVVSLTDAVRKTSGLAAENMGITERGRIAPGQKADLVLFDPATIIDFATPNDPHAQSAGIETVWVNGVVVFEHGSSTGERPGQLVRRGPE